MRQPNQNTNGWVTLSHMSRDVWVSGKELFDQLTHPRNGYRFFSDQSFYVMLAKLKKDGWFECRVSPHKPERFQYRLAARVVIKRTEKAPTTIRNLMYEAHRQARARQQGLGL